MTETRWVFIHPFQLRLQRGIEVYLWNLAAALAGQGVCVDILTWDGPLAVPDYANVPGLKLFRVPSVRFFQAQFAILYYVYWLLVGNYQHLFVQFAKYGEGPALRVAGWIRPIPFSVVFHFPRSLTPHHFDAFARWGFERNARHLIVVSQAMAREVGAWAGHPCAVIGHGVDTGRFQPDARLRAQIRAELNLHEDTPVLISVSALEERKGMQWVIQAMPELLKKNPELHYLILGDGQYQGSLFSLAADLGLEPRVHFLGAKLDVHPYLCAADIMMIPSRGEASSISLLEGLACKLPAITSAHPPFDELISSAWGFSIDERNIEQLVSTTTQLVENRKVRAEMGSAGRLWVTEHHDWQQIALQYRALIG